MYISESLSLQMYFAHTGAIRALQELVQEIQKVGNVFL